MAVTVREIVGDPDSSVSVNTLTTADGILNMTHAAKQECDDCLWVKADTGATDESVSLRSKAVKRLKQLGDLAEKTFIDTLVTEGDIVCVAPAKISILWIEMTTGMGVLVQRLRRRRRC